MIRNNLPAETLKNYMIEHGIDKMNVATLTESSVRSVERWMQYGVPKPKMTMLQVTNKKE
jgi:hypothetical protein